MPLSTVGDYSQTVPDQFVDKSVRCVWLLLAEEGSARQAPHAVLVGEGTKVDSCTCGLLAPEPVPPNVNGIR